MYDGAVKTVFIFALILSPIQVLPRLFSDWGQRKEVSGRGKRIWIAVWTIACIGLAVSVWFFFIKIPYQRLMGLQSLALIIAVYPFEMLEIWRGSSVKLSASFAVCAFAAILLVTGLYLLIERPVTAAGAERTLRDEGYQITEYIGFAPQNTNKKYGGFFPDEWNVEMGAYSFNAERGGEGYRVYVNAKSGGICAALSFDEYPRLAR